MTPVGGVEGDAGGLEAEALDVRRAADRDEDLVDLERLRAASGGAGGELQNLAVHAALHLGHADAHREAHAVAFQRHPHEAGGVGVLPAEEAVSCLHHGHARAEARERLGQLAADGPAAEHGEPPGQGGQREDGLVGEKACLAQPGNRRRGGARAGGDHGLLEAQSVPVHRDRIAGR